MKFSRIQLIHVLVGSVILAIAVSVIAGLFIVGSPKSERLARFDERRVNDAQMIQNEIFNYWQQKERLPQSLDELQSDFTYFVAPRDPQTGAPYEYRVLPPLKFELCATFSTASEEAQSFGYPTMSLPIMAPQPVGGPFIDAESGWAHGAGRACFMRTIDPERFGKDVKPQ
jgi:hypothetical protein